MGEEITVERFAGMQTALTKSQERVKALEAQVGQGATASDPSQTQEPEYVTGTTYQFDAAEGRMVPVESYEPPTPRKNNPPRSAGQFNNRDDGSAEWAMEQVNKLTGTRLPSSDPFPQPHPDDYNL